MSTELLRLPEQGAAVVADFLGVDAVAGRSGGGFGAGDQLVEERYGGGCDVFKFRGQLGDVFRLLQAAAKQGDQQQRDTGDNNTSGYRARSKDSSLHGQDD